MSARTFDSQKDKENCAPPASAAAAPPGALKKMKTKAADSGQTYSVTQYEISPYKDGSDSEDDDEGSRKPVPVWARGGELGSELSKQYQMDPDSIFRSTGRSCALGDLFKHKGNKRKPDFSRRSSSGDWARDKLTWQEEVEYRRAMGFVLDPATD